MIERKNIASLFLLQFIYLETQASGKAEQRLDCTRKPAGVPHGVGWKGEKAKMAVSKKGLIDKS